MIYRIKRFSKFYDPNSYLLRQKKEAITRELNKSLPKTPRKFAYWDELEGVEDYDRITKVFENPTFKRVNEKMARSGLNETIPFYIDGCIPRYYSQEDAWLILKLDMERVNCIMWKQGESKLRLFLGDKEVSYSEKRIIELARENYTVKNPLVKEYTDLFIKLLGSKEKRYSGFNKDEKYMAEERRPRFSIDRLGRKLREMGWSDREIDLTLDEYRNIDPWSEEAEEIMEWVETGKVVNPKVQEAMQETGRPFPAVFLERKSKSFSLFGSLFGGGNNTSSKDRNEFCNDVPAKRKYELLLKNFPRHTSPDHLRLLEIEEKLEGINSGEGGPRLRIFFDDATVTFDNVDYRGGRSYSWTEKFGWIDLDRRQIKDIRAELLKVVEESMRYWKTCKPDPDDEEIWFEEDRKDALKYLEALKKELQRWRK